MWNYLSVAWIKTDLTAESNFPFVFSANIEIPVDRDKDTRPDTGQIMKTSASNIDL